MRTGWRFNQPEGEMLVTLGNTLNMLQPGRRAYFIFLFKIEPSLPPSVYSINFKSNGEIISYKGERKGVFNYEVPPVMFSITKKNIDKTIQEYQKFVIGKCDLKHLDIQGTKVFKGLKQAKWSPFSVSYLDFDTLKNELRVEFDPKNQLETIDLSPFSDFPTKDLTKFYILEKIEVNSSNQTDKIDLTKKESLLYNVKPNGQFLVTDKNLTISTLGPRLLLFKRISSIGDKQVLDNSPILLTDNSKSIEITFYIVNVGTDIAENANLIFKSGKYFSIDKTANDIIALEDGKYQIPIGLIIPGESKELKVSLEITDQICANWYDNSVVVDDFEIKYDGPRSKIISKKEAFTYFDDIQLDAPAYDIFVRSFKSNKREVHNGETISLRMEISNGIVNVKSGITYKVFAIHNLTDTVLIYQDTLPPLDCLASFNTVINYTVPDTLYFLEFLLVVDPDDIINEICKGNNYEHIQMEILSAYWMPKVNVIPNPFDYFLSVQYVVSQDISHLDAFIYGIDGSFIKKIENCPHQMGLNTFYLEMPTVA
ncbi:MAG: hypothetical protein ACK42G_06710, partial [Candidatus Kapaibacteriota bacterium]